VVRLADVVEGAVLRDPIGREWTVVRRWGQRIGGWGPDGRWIEGATIQSGEGERDVDDLDAREWEVVR